MLQGIWDHWASGANQDAADEAIRTGNPVNMGLLESFYGKKEDAENIVKKTKQDQLNAKYGSALAEMGLMVDWGEDEQSVKSKIFRTRQQREAGQQAKLRSQALQDNDRSHNQSMALGRQQIEASNSQLEAQLKSQTARHAFDSSESSKKYAHERSEGKLDRRQQMELSDSKDSLQMQMAIMQNDLAEKRMDYDRETQRMDKRSSAIAQLMSGIGALGGAFAL